MCKSLKLTAAIVAVCMFSFQARAEREGHGGDGVIINGEPVLLDLVEAGVYRTPYFSNVKPEHYLVEGISSTFDGIDIDVGLLASKIQEIINVDPVFGRVTYLTIRMYEWSVVPLELVDFPDQTDSVLNLDGHELVQLAVRNGRRISISEAQWARLSSTTGRVTRVATVIHEALYAQIIPDRFSDRDGEWQQQRGSRAREVTGYLFNPAFIKRGRAGLQNKIGNDFYTLEKAVGSHAQSVWIKRKAEPDEGVTLISSDSGAQLSYINERFDLSARDKWPQEILAVCSYYIKKAYYRENKWFHLRIDTVSTNFSEYHVKNNDGKGAVSEFIKASTPRDIFPGWNPWSEYKKFDPFNSEAECRKELTSGLGEIAEMVDRDYVRVDLK